jgi:hypothetical protein
MLKKTEPSYADLDPERLSPRFAATLERRTAARNDGDLDGEQGRQGGDTAAGTSTAARTQATNVHYDPSDAVSTWKCSQHVGGAERALAVTQARAVVHELAARKPYSPFAAAEDEAVDAELANAVDDDAGDFSQHGEAGVHTSDLELGATVAQAVPRHGRHASARRRAALAALRTRCRRLDSIDMAWIAVTAQYPVREIRLAQLRNEVCCLACAERRCFENTENTFTESWVLYLLRCALQACTPFVCFRGGSDANRWLPQADPHAGRRGGAARPPPRRCRRGGRHHCKLRQRHIPCGKQRALADHGARARELRHDRPRRHEPLQRRRCALPRRV